MTTTFKMPEPLNMFDHPEHCWAWKKSEMEFIDARVNKALRDVLEQAAQLCDKQHDRAFTQAGAARASSCAEKIRAMKEQIK